MGFKEDDSDDDGGKHQHGKMIQGQSRGTRKKRKSIDLSVTCLASIESLSVPLIQEVVLSADMSCAECQKRVATVMSRMKETDSVVVNVVEKEVILSCKFPSPPGRRQVPTLYRSNNPFNKIAMFKRMFQSINSHLH